MQSPESDQLFSAIDALLCTGQRQAEERSCRAYWDTTTRISRAEIDMLASLGGGPQCVEALAERLGRDLATTHALLDAFSSVGIVELRDGRYVATPATALYCLALHEGRRFEDGGCGQE